MKRASQGKSSIRAYWENSNIRDAYWQETFPLFVEPLTPLFVDPAYAGALLLAAYLAEPEALKDAFMTTPERFGKLHPAAKDQVDSIYTELVDGSRGVSLDCCAQLFLRVQQATKRLDVFAKREPVLYRQLQRRRSALGGKRVILPPARTYSLNLKF